ncbi:MAG TPA: hypothetical protein VFS00_27680, partial [Polyangiaceae bacterium]|nr:hypothetical protein [Polyangiaceae bacterium]
GDLAHFGPREPWLPKLKEGEEGRTHTVTFPCDRLALAIEFEGADEDVVEPGQARAVVERQVGEGGVERWVRAIGEEGRCEVRAEGRAVELAVEAPVVGFRYTLVFRLRRPGRRLSPEARRCAEDLLAAVRRESTSEGTFDTPARLRVSARLVRAVERASSAPPGAPLADEVAGVLAEAASERPSALLTRAIEQALAHVLDERLPGQEAWLGPEGSWMGLLWFHERRQLVPAFGRFSLPSWHARFEAGTGVAGQAFRFGAPTVWSDDDQSIRSLIFQDRTPENSPYLIPYRWLVAVPLVSMPGESPVGVVSFAGTGRQTLAASRLHALAQDLTQSQDPDYLAQAIELRNDLTSVINASFWAWVMQYEQALGRRGDFARTVIATLVRARSEPGAG